MKSNTLFLAVVFCMTSMSCAFSQFSFNAGTGILSGFSSNDEGVFGGLHLGFEVPRNNDVTFYGRASYYFKKSQVSQVYTQALIDPTIYDPIQQLPPLTLDVNSFTSTDITIIEGGTRYYLGNGFDNGFSAYGGTNMGISFYGVSYNQIADYDTTLYYPIGLTEDKGSIFSLFVGLQGGVKYTIPAIGSIYFDITGSYAIIAQASSQSVPSTHYSPLLFAFNIGFRKDLY